MPIEKDKILNTTIKLFYENNKEAITLGQLSCALNTSISTLKKYLNKYSKEDNNFILPDCFHVLHKTLCHFDYLTEENSYWLGYLMADGCYTCNGRNREGMRLMLECKSDDKEILEKFCDFLSIRHSRITIGHHGKSVALSLSDNNFSTSVSKWGITRNKSHTENHVPEEILSNDAFFFQYLRGIIDGDGTIHTYKYSPGISFVSNSEAFCLEIKKKLELLLPVPSSIWLRKLDKEKQSKHATQPIYSLKIGTGGGGIYKGANSIFLFHKMYDNQPVILTRKYLSFRTLVGK